MIAQSYDEAYLCRDLVSADQHHACDGSIAVFYDRATKNRWQKTDTPQKEQQYQISEYTITDAYLQYWELLRTRNLTYYETN